MTWVAFTALALALVFLAIDRSLDRERVRNAQGRIDRLTNRVVGLEANVLHKHVTDKDWKPAVLREASYRDCPDHDSRCRKGACVLDGHS